MIRHPLRLALLSTALMTGVPVLAQAQPAAPISAPAETLVPVNAQDAVARAWGFADTDVPVDPAVRFGLLPNGLKYAIRRNDTPKDTVLVRLRIDHGKLSETDEEQGLAHFLEHLAFNGSTNVPEGEMVKLLERNGLAFGPDTNAGTGFDAITYRLDLPRNSPELLDTALMLMRETASNLTLDPAAVDRERGVIESERRARDTFGRRNALDGIAFEAPGTKLASRLNGAPEVIATASAERIRALYQATYRPETATVVVVGDIDPDVAEVAIRSHFADWRAVGAARGEADVGRIDLARPRAFDNWVHPDVGEVVSITWHKPWIATPETVGETRRSRLRALGLAVINRRLSRRTLTPDSPLVGASVGSSGLFELARVVGASARVKDGEWADALAILENEVRRAERFGVTREEVDEQLAFLRTGLENAVKSADTRRSGGLVGPILAASKGDGEVVVTTPAQNLALFERLSPDFTAEAVTAALRELLADRSEPLIRVTGKTPVTGGEAAIAAAFDAATRVALLPPASDTNIIRMSRLFAYTDWGPPGRVVSDDTVDDLGIRRVRFANNVMLNLKRTDFEDDRVRVGYSIDGGKLLATRDDPAFGGALASLVAVGGLEAHSIDQLRTILAGRDVAPGFGADTESFGAGANTTPRDLLLQLQLMAATVVHPGYRPEALALLRRTLPSVYDRMDASPEAVISRDIEAILSDNDPRYVTPPLGTVMALDWNEYRRVAGDSLANGAIEVTVVGDIDEQAAVDAVAATFGTLPDRRATDLPRVEARQRSFTAKRDTIVLLHQGQADQAALRLYWPTTDDSDLKTDLTLGLLSGILGLELTEELRERTGATYSPIEGSATSSAYPGWGFLFAGANLAPDKLEAARASVLEIAASLAAEPVDDDTLLRARAPMVERLVKARRNNGYWVAVASRASTRPERLDRSRQAIDVLKSLTAADVQAVARRYLTAQPVVIEARPDPDKVPSAG